MKDLQTQVALRQETVKDGLYVIPIDATTTSTPFIRPQLFIGDHPLFCLQMSQDFICLLLMTILNIFDFFLFNLN